MNHYASAKYLLALCSLLLACEAQAANTLRTRNDPPVVIAPKQPLVIPPAIRVESGDLPEIQEVSPPTAPVAPYKPQAAVIPADPKISVSNTEALSPEGTGILRSSEGGLPATLWAGLTRKQLDQWLPAISMGYRHESVRSLVSRLMRSEAELPEGKGNNYLTQRVRGLFQLGELDAAAKLAFAVPASVKDEELDMLRRDIALAREDSKAACEKIEDQIAEHDSIYWQKLLVFCQAATGNPDAAQVTLNVLEEKGLKLPSYFPQLIRRMQDKTTEIGALPEALPTVDAIMLIAAGYSGFTTAYLEKAPLPILRLLAKLPDAQENTRALALEKSVLYGGAPVQELQAFYESVAGTENTGFDPAKPYEGLKGRAQLWQLQKNKPQPEKRAQIVARGIQAFDKAGLHQLALMVYLNAIDTLTDSAAPAEAIKPILPFAVDALVLDNRLDKARRLAPANDTVGAFLAQGVVAVAPASNGNGWKSVISIPVPASISDNELRRLYRTLAVYEALALHAPEIDMSERPLSNPVAMTQVASPALLKQLQQAAENERIGEVVSLSAMLLGGDSLSRVSDETLVAVLKALQSVGMDQEARAVARDSLLALGR